MEPMYQARDGRQEASEPLSHDDIQENEQLLEAQVNDARREEDQYADHLAQRIVKGEVTLLPALAATVLRLQDLKGGHGYGWWRIMSDIRLRLYVATPGNVPTTLAKAIRGAAQKAWLDYRAESPAISQAWCQLPSGEIVSGRALSLIQQRRVAGAS